MSEQYKHKITCPLCNGMGTTWGIGGAMQCTLCCGDLKVKVQFPFDRILAAIGKAIGYGRLMQMGQELWRESLAGQNLDGGEFAIGPCVAMLVPCPCGDAPRCEWCCGTGRVTKRVAEAMKESRKP